MSTSTHRAPGSYGAGIRRLHWLLFGLLVVQYSLAWLFDAFGKHGAIHQWIVATHMSFGTLILVVAGLLVITRVTGSRPSNAFLPSWQQTLAQVVHGLIYLLILAQPLIGLTWVMSHGHAVPIFGLFSLPPIITSAPDWIGTAHGYVGWTLFWLLAFHILAALYHAMIRRDGVLQRMLARR